MIHFMQHIKNNLILIKIKLINIFNLILIKNKIIENIKIIGPSLSILKPETTAIYSILNRIIGIFLLIIIFIIFLPIVLTYFNFFSFFYYNILIICMFFFLFHIIYSRLKLTLYYNKIYLFINNNISIINNLLYIYLIFILVLIFFNIFFLFIIMVLKGDKTLILYLPLPYKAHVYLAYFLYEVFGYLYKVYYI